MLFRVRDLETVHADGHIALSGVSLEVEAGRMVAVLGPNGAGKSTLLRTVAGILPGQPRRGTVEIEGRPIERKDPEKIARRGVGFVSEARGLFRELTVGENLDVACWGRPAAEARADREWVHELFPVLCERSRQRADALSGGERQMLALGRVFLRRPRLLLLDEPSQGLSASSADLVFSALAEIAGRGAGILFAEPDASLALGVASEAIALEGGRVVPRV